jgi:hypothetical protein
MGHPRTVAEYCNHHDPERKCEDCAAVLKAYGHKGIADTPDVPCAADCGNYAEFPGARCFRCAPGDWRPTPMPTCTRCKCPECAKFESTILAGIAHMLVTQEQLAGSLRALIAAERGAAVAIANAVNDNTKATATMAKVFNALMADAAAEPPAPAPPKSGAKN